VLFLGCLQQHSCRQHGDGGDHVSIGRARQALTHTNPPRQ
jgi:hypothetical protein